MTSKCENSKTTKERSKTPNTIEEVFPWLSEFHKIIRSSTGSRNYQHLEESLFFYTQNIRSNISSNVKFGNAVIYNLKKHINNVLIFFHLYWFDIKQDIADHSSYLNKMSALLNVYIDMELKTSNYYPISVRDSKIAARILAALYIYLNNSEEHIFKVLLRIKNMEKYTKICNHIFMKSFSNLETKMTSITKSITDVAYVRYLLAFKMWEKVEEASNKKKKINDLAVKLLRSRMPKLRDELKFVPKPPKNANNEIPWLLHVNLKHTLHHFLLFEDKMDNNFGDLQRTKMICVNQSSSKFQKHQINSLFRSNSNGPKQEISNDHKSDLQSHNIFSIDRNKSLKKNKKKAGQIKHKQNKIIIIDITGDVEISKVKRKKTKLGYLKIMEENIKKKKKHINHLKSSSQLLAANKKSSNKSSKISDKNTCFEYKFISDNKVSDSTKSYISNSNKSSLNDVCCIDLQKNEHACLDFMKENEIQQHDYNPHYIKSPMFVDQNIKDIKVTANVLNKSKPENHISSHVTYVTGNVISSYSNPVMQNKEVLTSQEESAMETISVFKMCQNNNADQHCFKQELPTSTDCNVAQKYITCKTVPVDVHVYVVNHIGERIMPMHAEKRVQCLDKSNDTCTVSTTFNGDQIIDPALYNQHFDNMRMNDYGNVAKYSEIMMKEQQERNDCDSSILNNRIHSSEPCTHDINSFEIGSNAEVDYELKNFPKIEMDEITNTDYLFNNIQSKTQEDFLQQSSAVMPQINYDDLIKTQDTFHSMFNDNENDVELPYDTNVIYMLNDHDNHDDHGKYVYVSNLTDERVMTTNAEKKAECVNNSNDMCVVSTTFTEDQIVGSSWDDQYVNFDNKRKCDYEDSSSNYSKATMKEQQGRGDCDTSMSNDRLYPSKFCAFDIDSFEMDSKEVSEIMKIDCIDDFENIDF